MLIMKRTIGWAAMLVVLALAVMFAYASWRVGGYVNYNLSYKSMVQDTVRDMVKPESLR